MAHATARSSGEAVARTRVAHCSDAEKPAIPLADPRIRQEILRDHIEAVLHRLPSIKTLPQSLALEDAMGYLRDIERDEEHRVPGGLTTTDLHNLTPVPPPVVSGRISRELEKELRGTLLSIADYWDAGESAETDENERLEDAMQLPGRIRAKRKLTNEHDSSLQERRSRVARLVERINEAQSALETKLVEALTTLPPHLHATRVAEAELVAATIEAALLKLSLVRTRAHHALYGHSSPDNPDATVSRAVATAYEKLKERQKAQETETQKLDRQIEEYERMLRLVDGRDGSFGQVVKDMARVKRETEECRKDLRRLGWTGD